MKPFLPRIAGISPTANKPQKQPVVAFKTKNGSLYRSVIKVSYKAIVSLFDKKCLTVVSQAFLYCLHFSYMVFHEGLLFP